MTKLSLDFETKSKVDLPKFGADVYSRDATTRALMLAWRFDNEPVRLWLPHKTKMPTALRDGIESREVTKTAWNAAFELAITRNTLGIDTDVRDWRCVMVMALSLGLPGKLEVCLRDALRLPKEFHKDPEGDRLMRLFSYPSSKATWETHPEEFSAYGRYCMQDVTAECKAYDILLKYIPNIESLFRRWAIDREINDRGLPVDVDFINSALKLAEVSKARYREQLKEMTGLDNPNSTPQMGKWLKERGYPFASLAKNRVQIALVDHADAITQEAKDVIKVRLESNKTSLAKYKALLRSQFGGRLRDTLQYMGAGATGRWAGRILGQNMPRPWKGVEEYLREARELIADGDLEGVEQFFGKPLEVLASSIRSAISPPPGRKLVVADLSSIELVVIAWLTRCKFWLGVLDRGEDAYKAFAVEWLQIEYEMVTKAQRTLSKPPALGCFGAETEILTERGWLPIIAVTLDDRVFDGVEFVRHDGVIDQGLKAVIDMHGVDVTPDHEILCGEGAWLQAQHVARGGTATALATESVTGSCSGLNALKTAAEGQAGITYASAITAGAKKLFGVATLKGASQALASSALAGFGLTTAALCMGASASVATTWTVYLTGSTLCGLVALAVVAPCLSTLAAVSSVALSRRRTLSGTPSLSTGGTILSCTPTDATTTATTSRATFASLPAPITKGTSAPTKSSSTKASHTWQRTFIGFLRLATETYLRSLEKFERASVRRKSLKARQSAEVPTFDILNAGPRSRFVIRTEAGPMIAHNCGYRMGAGRAVGTYPDIEKTGLWGYAANMQVQMSQKECRAAVKIYRKLSPEIKDAWKELEESAMECVRSGEPQRSTGGIVFDLKKPFLRMRLPSGRFVHYCRPRIEKVQIEFEDEETGEVKKSWTTNITYERLSQQSKKWVRRANHGGRFIEQAVQGIARDILEIGILNAEKEDMNVVAHYHDEILCEMDESEGGALKRLIECMTRTPKWAGNMTLRAAGYESNFYKKE